MSIERKKALLQALGREATAGEERGVAREARVEGVMEKATHAAAYLPLALGLMTAAGFCLFHYSGGANFRSGATFQWVRHVFVYMGLLVLLGALEAGVLIVFRDTVKGWWRWVAIGAHLGLVLVAVGLGPAMAGSFAWGRRGAWAGYDMAAIGREAAELPMPKVAPAGGGGGAAGAVGGSGASSRGSPREVITPFDSAEYGKLPPYIRDTLRPTKVVLLERAVILEKVGGGWGDGSDGLVVPRGYLGRPAEEVAKESGLEVKSKSPVVFRYTGLGADFVRVPGLVEPEYGGR